MRTFWTISLSFGLVGLTAGNASAVILPSSEARSNEHSGRVAQAGSPYQQLLQTRSCVECNLSNLDLQGLDLSGANLQDANLSNANLSNSNLRQANLTGANLYLTKFSGSDLSQSNFSNASAKSADFSGAILTQSTFDGTIATYANFSNADFSEASIDGSNFSDANFTAADFSNASVSGTKFNYATLDQSNFGTARVVDSPFVTASTVGATLPSATTLADSTSNGDEPSSEDVSSDVDDSTPDNSTPALADSDDEQYNPSPLQLPPTRLFNLETANTLPGGGLVFTPGTRLFFSDEFGGGAGLQVNTGSVDYGITDRLQIGLAFDVFDDPLADAVRGQETNVVFAGVAPSIKYQVVKSDDLAISVLGSVEAFRLTREGGLFLQNISANSVSSNIVGGSIQVPVTYNFSKQLQAHLTPSVTFLPETINGAPFYGTTLSVGAGVGWQSERVGLFADIAGPLVGDNAVRSSDSSLFKSVAWSTGLRYLVNPAAGVDVYLTNALGYTPGTHILTMLPNADQVAVGVNLNFAPDFGQNYEPSFRKNLKKLTPRDTQLLLEGITVSTADTLLPRTLRVRAGTGIGSQVKVSTGLTHDVQLDLFGEDFDQPNATTSPLGSGLKVGASAKVRLLDQVQGDPLSISVKGAFTQDVDEVNGTSSGELIFQYRPIPRLALMFNPKVGVAGNTILVGPALGANLEIAKGFQLLGEVTPVITARPSNRPNPDPVWSAAVRYFHPKAKLGADVYVSNAIGQNSFSALAAQSDVNVGFNVHWIFGGD